MYQIHDSWLKGNDIATRTPQSCAAEAIRQGAWNSLDAPGVGTCCVERLFAAHTVPSKNAETCKNNAHDDRQIMTEDKTQGGRRKKES